MVKRIITKFFYVTSQLYNFVLLKYYSVAYEKDLKINGILFCVSNNKNGIVIGKGVSINSCRAANPIGEKSVIGAGSVVTKNIPDGEIWAGNPAKFIRKIS